MDIEIVSRTDIGSRAVAAVWGEEENPWLGQSGHSGYGLVAVWGYG